LCLTIGALLLAFCFVSTLASACPFCTAVGPTLSQRRESAAVVALGELVESGPAEWKFQLHKVSKGKDFLADPQALILPAERDTAAPALALLLAEKSADVSDRLAWSVVPLDEAAAAYVFRAPDLRKPTAERLAYFAPFLEHANPLVADDSYREFGHARYVEVAQVADRLPMARLRRWLTDPGIPQERKGFYGLALGLARDPADRQANIELLTRLILTPESDFRAGFDGVLGGYLVAAGEPALDLIEKRYLANPDAAHGDVRHAMTALRFYREFGRDIPADGLRRAMRHLLARPEFAADAIADLSRWEDWDSLPQVVALFDRPEFADPPTRRAIIGYLRACPQAEAATELARLRQLDPKTVAEAEKYFSLLKGGR
jgi:hypothetical protein